MKRTIFLVIMFGLCVYPAVGYALPNPDLIVQYINEERINAGVKELRVDTKLMKASRDKADGLALLGYLVHTSAPAGTPWSVLTQAGYEYSKVGENLSVGNSTAREVVDNWMASPSHRENILNPSFEEVGAGSVSGFFIGQPSDYAVAYFAKPKSFTAPIQKSSSAVASSVNTVTLEKEDKKSQNEEEKEMMILLQIIALLQELIKQITKPV